MQRTNQTGSVLGFVVVGVILAALLIGGVYIVRQYGENPTNEETTSNPQPRKPENPTNEQRPQDTTSDNRSSNQSSQSSKDDSETKSDRESSSEPQVSENTTRQDSTTSSRQEMPTTGGDTGQLPQTGPIDDGLQVLGGATLIAAIVAYVRSRRVLG